MAWFIGAISVFGQTTFVQTLEDGSTIFPILGESNLVQLDPQGRLEGVLNSQGGLTTFSYDDTGNLSQHTAADLAVTDYGYDSLSRLTSITNQGVEVAVFDHDSNGNIVEATSPSLSTTTFGYDEMNQLIASTQTVNGVTAEVGYQYDLNGNRSHVTYPGNTNAVYVYGADNRLESVDLSAFGKGGVERAGSKGRGQVSIFNIYLPPRPHP